MSRSCPLARSARKKLRPIRPKPFTPTRVATLLTPETRTTTVPSRLSSDARSPGRVLSHLLDAFEHLRREVGLRVGDAEVLGVLVGHGEQPSDPTRDRV